MAQYVVLHYHEVALKGRNRSFFVNRLIGNLREATASLGVTRIRNAHGGLVVELAEEASWEKLQPALGRVFGIANFALAERCKPDFDEMKEVARGLIAGLAPANFRIDAHRGDKSFPMKSDAINRELGAFVQELTGWPVRLKRADLVLSLEVLPREVFVYREKLPGAGGLPVGSGGRVAALLSGGIDSPVAAWRIMKRGCEVVFVHFHGYPFLNESSIEKAADLVRHLTAYQLNSRLYLVPFGETQRQIVVDAPAPFRTVLYRRMMVRIAERIAAAEHAAALVTGESLGQVASQTLENVSVIDRAATLPILRPLIGMDKAEIIREAEQIGTYPISIIPDQDCCQLFMPRRPSTRAPLAEIERAEAGFDLDRLLRLALEDVERREFTRERVARQQVSLAPSPLGTNPLAPFPEGKGGTGG